MVGMILGFFVWALLGIIFIGLGIYSLFTKKAMGFWANAKVAEIADIKKYNCAMAKLFCIYGIVFLLLGLPLLAGQNSPWIIISILGVMFESIGAMVVYTTVIEKKYKK